MKECGGDYVSKEMETIIRIRNGLTVIVEDLNGFLAEQEKSAPISASTKVSMKSIENVEGLFTTEMRDLLAFSEKNGKIIVKPRQYLGSENFAKIAAKVRDEGGEYVSAGKDSHFTI